MVEIRKPDSMKDSEVEQYIQYIENKAGRKVKSIEIALDESDPEYVGLTYTLEPVPFERIRRITGYLVGSMDHWNDAKTSEEGDRVKHGVQ